jgi:hypothetical protein
MKNFIRGVVFFIIIIACNGGLLAQFRSTQIIFENRTEYALYHNVSTLGHGIWSTVPPQLILPESSVTWKSESRGIGTGTEGVIYFAVVDPRNKLLLDRDIRIHWSNPAVGSNKLELSGPTNFHFVHTPIGGENSIVRITVNSGDEFDIYKDEPTIMRRQVYIIDLRITTADETDAGTDNDVYFSIGSLTWLLQPLKSDDNPFERGGDDMFSFNVDDLNIYTDDIIFMQLEKKGDLGFHGTTDSPWGEWKVDSVELWVDHELFFSFAVKKWISSPQDPYWRELIQSPKAADQNSLFFNSIRRVPNDPEVKGPTIACQTTFMGKMNSISGWLNWSLPNIKCIGRTLWKPTYSADGLATIDIQITSLEIISDSRIFYVNRPMFIRVEYRMILGCVLPGPPSIETLNAMRDQMIQGGRLPGENSIIEVWGPVLWDTDDGGHFEIHPLPGNLVVRN